MRTQLGPLASRNALRGRPAQLVIMLRTLNPMPKALSCAMSDCDLKVLSKSDKNSNCMKVTMASGV